MDQSKFSELTGVTLSERFFKIQCDDYIFNRDPEYTFEEFCKDWREDEKDKLITCLKRDFDMLEAENIEMKAEIKRLKAKIYSFHVSDGLISLSVTSKAE